MAVNFTGGLLKLGDTYINPNQIKSFKKDDCLSTINYVNGKSDQILMPADEFANRFIEAQNTGNIIDLSI